MRALALLPALALPALAQDDAEFERPAVLRGRFLLADGSPAEGVDLQVNGAATAPARTSAFGTPGAWFAPGAQTDAGGRFELRFVPPRGYEFSLEARRAGYATATWEWDRIDLGQVVDLGDVALVPAGTVVGVVLDDEGRALTRSWSAFARAEDPGGAGSYTLVHATVDPGTGEFRLAGVPAGPALVGARGLGVELDAVPLEVAPGVESYVELVYSGPDLARRVAVSTYSSYATVPNVGAVRLVAQDGSIRTPSRTAGSRTVYVFDDVPEGEHRVEIADPSFERWSRSGVRPGESVSANLDGSAGIALEVVDAATGRPRAGYGLSVLVPDFGEVREHALKSAWTPPPADGVYRDLLPCAQTLVVQVEGAPPRRVALPDLAPGELRRVRVEVDAARVRAARVVEVDGSPAAFARAEWTPGGVAGRPGFSSRSNGVRVPAVAHAAAADLDGRFPVPALDPGLYTVRVRVGPHVYADRTIALPLAGDEEPTFTLPPWGRLRGDLRVPAGADAAALALRFPTLPSCEPRVRGLAIGAARFDVGPLAVGTWPVELLVSRVVPDDEGVVTVGHAIPLGTVTIRGGETTDAPAWDVTETYPAVVGARVHADGAPIVGAHLHFERADADARTGGAAAADAAGRHPGELVAPGTWTVVVTGGDAGRWAWVRPEPIDVAAGEELALDLDVPLAPRTIRFLDEPTGRPLADHEVLWWTAREGYSAGHEKATTDADGRLVLTRPPGPVLFARGPRFRIPAGKRADGGNRLMVRVVWTPGDDELVVRLPAHER